jgi:hypothetical protein
MRGPQPDKRLAFIMAAGQTMLLEVHQVDAFTSVPFAGNPAAVCLLTADQLLEDSLRLSIAAEINLAETAFLEPVGQVRPRSLSLQTTRLAAASCCCCCTRRSWTPAQRSRTAAPTASGCAGSPPPLRCRCAATPPSPLRRSSSRVRCACCACCACCTARPRGRSAGAPCTRRRVHTPPLQPSSACTMSCTSRPPAPAPSACGACARARPTY